MPSIVRSSPSQDPSSQMTPLSEQTETFFSLASFWLSVLLAENVGVLRRVSRRRDGELSLLFRGKKIMKREPGQTAMVEGKRRGTIRSFGLLHE